jgi:hypothetical protein
VPLVSGVRAWDAGSSPGLVVRWPPRPAADGAAAARWRRGGGRQGPLKAGEIEGEWRAAARLAQLNSRAVTVTSSATG